MSGYLYAHTHRSASLYHALEAEPWNQYAICGVYIMRDSIRGEPPRPVEGAVDPARLCAVCRRIMRAKEAAL